MEESKSFKLFVLKENPFFDKGTLMDLDDTLYAEGYKIIDTGNGKPGFINEKDLFVCPRMSENIPPSQCLIKITSVDFNADDVPSVSVFKNIHFQQVKVTLPEKYKSLQKVILTERLKGFEDYEMENPSLEKNTPENILSVEVSHTPPGFYELLLKLNDELTLTVHYIKFYPEYLKERYQELLGKANADIEEGKKEKARKENADMDEYVKRKNKEAVSNIISDEDLNTDLLNTALNLVTEWGENYNKPINERILKLYPELTADKILSLTKAAREAESFIYNACEQELEKKITETEIYPIVKMKYPWMNDNNIGRLKSIGMFYARK